MMRKTPKTTNKPTPKPTTRIKTHSSQPICPAITFKSGSATVTATPIKKVMSKIIQSRFCLKRVSPTTWPIRVIDKSAPTVNKVKPKLINKAEMAKAKSPSPLKEGTTPVKNKTKTTKKIGTTDRKSVV